MGSGVSKEEHEDDDSEISDQLHLLQSGEQSDLTIQCDNQHFNVHSHILSARSDIFKLLISELHAKRRLLVQDIGPPALEKVLHYMYSGQIPSMSIETAMKVYEAAEIYLVGGLRRKCGAVIKNKLNETNACEVLAFSDHLRGNYLKDVVITYLSNNTSFLKSENWRRFAEQYPKLATDVHLAFIRKN